MGVVVMLCMYTCSKYLYNVSVCVDDDDAAVECRILGV